MLTDQTIVGGTKWKSLRAEAMEPDYKKRGWYKTLSHRSKHVLKDLRKT